MSKKYTILLVEDEESMVTLIKYNLEQEGYIFSSVKNGKLALEFCDRQRPDLILSDISMPEMDGYELRERLIGNENFRDIPFIFLTAKTQTDDKFRGMGLGVNHFLIKPFEPELLLLTISSILGGKE
ncbi:MAG: response regulator [Calditrichia bacterium]|nr:response regulator [Calditrichia bacterium]